MFFRKKKETDVDVLQKIKDRIAEDDKKTETSTISSSTTDNFDDDILTDTNDIVDDDNDNKTDEVIDDINKVVEQSIVENDDEKDSFESSLESDFLADVLSEDTANSKTSETMDDGDGRDADNETDVLEDEDEEGIDDDINGNTSTDGKRLGLDGKYYTEDDLTYMSADRLRELGFLDDQGSDQITPSNEKDLLDQDNEVGLDDTNNTNDADDDDVAILDAEDELDDNKTNSTKTNDVLDDDVDDVGTSKDVEPADKAEQEYLDDVFDDNDASEYLDDDDNSDSDNTDSVEDKIDGGVDDVVLGATSSNSSQDSDNNSATFDVNDGRRAISSHPISQITNTQSREKNIDSNAYNQYNIDNQNRTTNIQNVGNVSFPAVPNDGAVNVLTEDTASLSLATEGKSVVSSQTKASVKGSITDLIENVKNQILNKRQERANSYRATNGKTIEQFVEDLIRPKLVEYLDANLDRLVKDAVEKEIQKIVAEVDTENV